MEEIFGKGICLAEGESLKREKGQTMYDWASLQATWHVVFLLLNYSKPLSVWCKPQWTKHLALSSLHFYFFFDTNAIFYKNSILK